MIVVADTSPISYLILIEQIELLPHFYGRIIIPPAVLHELQSAEAPPLIQGWVSHPPGWLEIRPPSGNYDSVLAAMDPGEREAIALAQELNASYLIADDMVARSEASRRHLKVVGTLGILRNAARENLLNLPTALRRLAETSFRADRNLIQSLLDEETARTKRSG